MSDYTLRQTTPEQVTTHWDTCYTLHSACMERKVETMTRQRDIAVQALEYLSEHGPAAYSAIARQALHAMGAVT